MIRPAPAGGTVTATGRTWVCQYLPADPITLTGNTGQIVHWERKKLSESNWVTINSNRTTIAPDSSTSGTFFYRARVGNGNCDTVSNIIEFTVREKPVGSATVSGNEICSGTQVTVTLHNQGSGVPAYKWSRNLIDSIIGIDTSGNGGTITGTPVFTSQTINSHTLIFTCLITVNTCFGDPFTARVKVKPLPLPQKIIGDFDVCQQEKTYKITLTTDETCLWTITPSTLGNIDEADISEIRVNWKNAGEGKLRVLVNKNGCSTLNDSTVTVGPNKAPADSLARMNFISNDTLVLLCQKHINETAKDYLFSWGFENKRTGGETLLAQNTNKSYWIFPDFNLDSNRYFVLISYKNLNTCIAKTYYIPLTKESISVKNDLLVFPNPNNGIFSITIDDEYTGPMELIIYNLTGQECFRTSIIKKFRIQSYHLTIPNLTTNIYPIVVRLGNGVQLIKKMIIY